MGDFQRLTADRLAQTEQEISNKAPEIDFPPNIEGQQHSKSYAPLRQQQLDSDCYQIRTTLEALAEKELAAKANTTGNEAKEEPEGTKIVEAKEMKQWQRCHIVPCPKMHDIGSCLLESLTCHLSSLYRRRWPSKNP